MIKTKRVVAAVLAVLTLFNLTSCGGKAENTNKGLSDRTAAQTEFKGNDNTVNSIKNLEPKATVTDGLSIYQADVAGCEGDVTQWLNKVGISR